MPGAEPSDGAGGSKQAGAKLDSGLYIVATPIGNARDLTLRARDVLASVDIIACEDTRVTAKLLAIHGIAAPLFSYHEHNAERARPILLERMQGGAAIALVSDAGTPLVSDPGFKLVRDALARQIRVTGLPGPSAALAALVLSGLPTDRFFFAGFLSAKAASRRASFAELKVVPGTLIFFETGPRLAASLADAASILGDRQAAVARELTKLYEEVRRGSLLELAEHYRGHGAPKGEIVIVVAPPEPEAPVAAEVIDRHLSAAMGRLSLSEAASAVALATGSPRRLVYSRALALKAGRE